MQNSFTRKELYDRVWSESKQSLAPKLGVSDVALAKACRKADIPVPERGYWAKKQAGKPTIKPRLPLRFPGKSEIIDIGGRGQGTNLQSDYLHDPVPPPPEFHENLSSLLERIGKMVGKVPYLRTTTRTHPIIKKLLEQDDERRKDFEERGYSWQKPLFDSAIERRRLRILNAIFLATQGLGCRPNMSISKYDDEKHEASIQVGDRCINFTLKATPRKGTSKGNTKDRLHLSIQGNQHNSTYPHCWKDTKDSGLEKSLNNIVVGIITAGELQYRAAAQWHHDWLVQRKAELAEEDRQRIIEEKRKARELREKQERERLESLLSDAMALQHAEIIRSYVKTIRSKSGEISVSDEDIEKWASWALAQADKIDPLINLNFLNEMDDTQPPG